MAENTKIEWATHSWSPIIGCSKIHVGCEHCYGEAQAGRHGVTWGPNGTRRKTSEAYWRKPLGWDRKAAKTGERPRVFASLCDVFEDWDGEINDVDGETVWNYDNYERPRFLTIADIRGDFFRLIDRTPNINWLLLTKRPENVLRMWPPKELQVTKPFRIVQGRENVWLGVSVSDQKTADELIPELLKLRDFTPCLFVSAEPLLGCIDLELAMPCGYYCDESVGHVDHSISRLDWLIVGGESGPKARPCNVEWIRSLAEQCKASGVPCFIKQDSGRYPGQQGRIPDDLWAIKEYPKCLSE